MTDSYRSDFYYNIFSTGTFSRQLVLYSSSPSCYFSATSGWAITQGAVVLGSHPEAFLTINPATGIYSIAPGIDQSYWGTYTVKISSVTLKGVTYDQSSLATPSAFLLYVHRDCYKSVWGTTPTNFALYMGDPIALYPASGPAFTEYTDSKSVA